MMLYMDEELDPIDTPRARRKERKTASFLGLALDALAQRGGMYLRTMLFEFELFLGTALALIGVLGFESGKYCDGNTADYLSCTHPTTYYYFNVVDIALVVLGACLVLVWVLNRTQR
jgi:hypothetical protein